MTHTYFNLDFISKLLTKLNFLPSDQARIIDHWAVVQVDKTGSDKGGLNICFEKNLRKFFVINLMRQ